MRTRTHIHTHTHTHTHTQAHFNDALLILTDVVLSEGWHLWKRLKRSKNNIKMCFVCMTYVHLCFEVHSANLTHLVWFTHHEVCFSVCEKQFKEGIRFQTEKPVEFERPRGSQSNRGLTHSQTAIHTYKQFPIHLPCISWRKLEHPDKARAKTKGTCKELIFIKQAAIKDLII